MSGSELTGGRHGLGYAKIASRWGWFVGLGIVMVLAGIFAFIDVVAATLVSAMLIGAFMLVGGVFQVVHAFQTKGWSAFAWYLICGVMYVIGGLLIMQEPVQGAFVITLFLAAALVVGGVMRVVIALRHREIAAWWLLLFGGLVSIGIGIVVYGSLPWSGLWVLGTLIGVELIVQGVTWISMGLAMRKMRRFS